MGFASPPGVVEAVDEGAWGTLQAPPCFSGAIENTWERGGGWAGYGEEWRGIEAAEGTKRQLAPSGS